MTRFGYVRVSTDKQEFAAQKTAIRKRFAIDEWVSDRGTGKIMQPNLLKLCNRVKKGDELVVWAFDRLGRSVPNVVSTVQFLKKKGVSVLSVKEGVDINSPTGNMIFQMMCSIAEFEASIISERIKTGLAAAVERGSRLGARPLSEKPEFHEILELAKHYRRAGLSYRAVTEMLHKHHDSTVSYGTIYSYLSGKRL